MKPRYLFSIVIPMYNTEKYIGEALDSILRQDEKSYEVVIINDGSTDKSLEVASTYKDKFKDFKIINKKNAGIIEARKDGIINSSGEYIVFLDSDDYLSDDCLKIFKNNIKKYNPDIVRGNFCEYYKKSNTYKKQIHFRNKVVCLEDKEKFFFNIIGDYRYNDVVRQAFRKSLVDINQIPNNISMGDDVAISYICFKNANKICFIKDIVYYYRINENSICHRYDEKTINNNLIDITCLYTFLIDYLSILKSKRILKRLYVTYFKLINMYYSLLFFNSDDKDVIEKNSIKLFELDLLIKLRDKIKSIDLVSKDFVLLVCLYKNQRERYLFFLKHKQRIKHLLNKS